jgi:prophage antirepressor-like protein
MAAFHFTASDVVRLLGLQSTQDVENLIASKVLDVSAYTRRGRPLFDVDCIRKAAAATIGRQLLEGRAAQ